VVAQVKSSKLRGRGGAGFPTGVKWELCSSAQGDGKNIICNADEGDPGAYMDRSILEGDPHSIIEGMLIGALRWEPGTAMFTCARNIRLPLSGWSWLSRRRGKRGFLGSDIFGSGFDFDIEMNRGAGAFVCGEETALIQSIEGNWGEPKPRPRSRR